MDKELKLIVEANGKEIFTDAELLMQQMRQAGCSEKKVMTAGLILKSCPAVGRVLAQEQVTQADVGVLMSTTLANTGLSAYSVRLYLSAFLNACGVRDLWVPYMMTYEPQPTVSLSPMIPQENETVEELSARLSEDQDRSDAIHDLDALSQSGNIRASYALGTFYKKIDETYHTENGKHYFERAARQGYGPANGALADYAVCGKRKDIRKAAKYFENPTTLSGADGRSWTKLSEQLLDYREENALRSKLVLRLEILMLVLTVAAIVLMEFPINVWNVFCILIQIGNLGWTVISRWFNPYQSNRYMCYCLILSWILLGLSAL